VRFRNEEIIMNGRYNGWSNRETWLVNLWLNNDEDHYRIILLAKNHSKNDIKRAHWIEQHLAEQLEDKLGEASLWSDLLSTAFYHVNWLEVIQNNE